jgi:CRISPR-associated endoribonuclease Cas6
MKYRLHSPAVISVKRDYSIHAQYLSPQDPDYASCFINNLITKYKAHMVANAGGLVEDLVKSETLGFRLTGEPNKKGVVIKALSEGETKVIGYLFDFELTAPIELQEIGYYAGFGEKNSMGFGCGEVW